MKQKLGKYNSFTLVELLVVTIIIGIIIPIMVGSYTFLIKSNKEISARELAIQQGYEFFERLNILMQDYTVDYEEYYNRQMVGCVNSGGLFTGKNFKWNVGVSGYCTEFTAYGNQNSTKRKKDYASSYVSSGYHDIYYCSTVDDQNMSSYPIVVKSDLCGKYGVKQSFGQYKALFTDVKGGASNKVGDYDDEDLGYLLNTDVNAIVDENNIQELYLISHDGKSRLFFRRRLVNNDSGHAQYKVQMLRLRGFDAGRDHDFSKLSEGSYDMKIDTWACDAGMGFICGGKSVSGAYSLYKLPKDVDDGWIDLTYGNTNIYTRNISISPRGDPDLYWAKQDYQINPFMKILIVNGVYLPNIQGTVSDSIMDFKIPLETTINMKDFYRE